MASITSRRELRNARIYFVPAGTVLALGAGSSSLTVGADQAFPDNDPTTNYTDYQFAEVETVSEEMEKVSEKFKIPDETFGGYIDDDEEMVIRRLYKGETHKTNALFKRLQWGLAANPVIGTAASLGAAKDCKIEGVCLMEISVRGTITDRAVFYARLRLTDPGKVGPETAKLAFQIGVLPHASNSYLSVA